jgi:glycosyltransferase involved in cell wall biosynthesis
VSRGRIVMLVDNSVRNDSRVQKQARSAAEMGWEVILIGKAPGQKPERFKLGEAQVRLIPVAHTLGRRRYQLRSGLRRGSLSYPTPAVASYRERQVEVKKYDARLRRTRWEQEVAEGRRSDRSWKLGRAWTKAALAKAYAEERWVTKRSGATRDRIHTRSRLDSPVGEAYTRAIQKVMGDRAWRVFDPHLWDFELAFGPVVDRLQPDIIHANDFAMVGLGARAALRARAQGRTVKFVYDAHEYVPGMNAALRHPWWLPAQVACEREYIGYADAVVTVSEPLADMLAKDHGIPRPTVVLNAPVVDEPAGDEPVPSLRQLCGIDKETPLLVYSGSMTPQRGVQIMIEALPRLPEAHVAYIVASTDKPFIKELMERSEVLGVADRVHWLPYVAPEHVVEYVSEADIGVHPTHHFVNHEISLATKFFEYAHAGLPIVVSDVKTMADMVNTSGQGEVFRAEDLDDYVRAVQAVLADPERYRAAYASSGLLDEWTWRKQAEILDTVYERLIHER